LTQEEIEAGLAGLAGWGYAQGKLHREYRFEDFVHAFGFMAAAALAIEKRDHHPDWTNSWNRVKVELTTHSSGGVTRKDTELAAVLEPLARQFGALE
jgi:4a-hydroxytetrahydrobiopterin dehydratase